MSFASLGLSDALVRAVSDAGYEKPTPIQTEAIPVVLSGHDLLAGAQTGTGKTAGFVLPIMQRLLDAGSTTPRVIRTLILTPTRELAAQVEESVRVYGKHTKLKSTVVYGGVSINPQINALRNGVDILVATPGRLLDHHGQRTIDLSHVEILVLDEADRMLDMGFIHDIKRVLKILPTRRQNLLFSATFSDEIRDLAGGLLNAPKHIQVTPRNTTVQSVSQRVLTVDAKRKAELLIHLVKEHNWFQVLVFTRTKHGANKLAAQLDKCDIPALAIHGNKSQNARTRALNEFKSGKLQVLVATDIAARGIDIDNLPHVVNFDLPNVPEDYVHRIGRTGRAGAKGEALSLVAPDEISLLRDIERLIKRTLARDVIPGFERGSAPINPPVEPSRRELQRQGSTPARGSAPHNQSRSSTRSQPRAEPRGQAKTASKQASRRPSGGTSLSADTSTASHRSPTSIRESNGREVTGRAGSSRSPNRNATDTRTNGNAGTAANQRPLRSGAQNTNPASRQVAAKNGDLTSHAVSGSRGIGAGSNGRFDQVPVGVRSNLPPGWPSRGDNR